jgi:hypothetical protein
MPGKNQDLLSTDRHAGWLVIGGTVAGATILIGLPKLDKTRIAFQLNGAVSSPNPTAGTKMR